jgi:hypothetical protein
MGAVAMQDLKEQASDPNNLMKGMAMAANVQSKVSEIATDAPQEAK